MCESWSFNIYKNAQHIYVQKRLERKQNTILFFLINAVKFNHSKKKISSSASSFFFWFNCFFLSLMFDILCKSFSFVFCLYTFKIFFLVYIPFYELVHLVLILHLFSSFSHFVTIFILFPNISLVLDISSWNCLFSVKCCLFLYSMFKCNIKTCWIFSIFYL